MKKRRLLALLAACVMLLTSCGSPQASNEGSQGSEPSSSETVERRGYPERRSRVYRTERLPRLDHLDGYL